MGLNGNHETTATLSEFLSEYREATITFSTTSLIEDIDGLNMPVRNIYDKYIDILKSRCSKVELNDEEYYKYRFKPHSLSYIIYGTTELWFLILLLNDKQSLQDFEFKDRTIYLLPSSELESINRIFINEEANLAANRKVT